MSYSTDSPRRESPAALSPPAVQGIIAQRHRKSASTGGGRAWSTDEENYLIETRLRKMPYKHIAAYLKKTELACRLHYHQLSFGNKRHRRAPSPSSFASTERSPTSPLRKVVEVQQRQLPPFNPTPDPDQCSQYSDSVSTSPQSHVPILPKPFSSPHRACQQIKGLRLIIEDIEQFEERKGIDMARLNRIYNAHRQDFWTMIARSYGANVLPSLLEEAWRREYSTSRADLPPTPCGSPQSSKACSSVLGPSYSSVSELGKGFTPINTPQSTKSVPSAVERGSFAISSLLTEDKEVRSPAQDRKQW